MTELSFHSSLYPAEAVASAVEVYAQAGQFELVRGAESVTVRCTANDGIDESLLARELSNYVLGITAESRGDG